MSALTGVEIDAAKWRAIASELAALKVATEARMASPTGDNSPRVLAIRHNYRQAVDTLAKAVVRADEGGGQR